MANYWTSSGPYDEIFYYIRNHMEEVRDDLVLMVAGDSELGTKEEYICAICHVPFEKALFAPNIIIT